MPGLLSSRRHERAVWRPQLTVIRISGRAALDISRPGTMFPPMFLIPPTVNPVIRFRPLHTYRRGGSTHTARVVCTYRLGGLPKPPDGLALPRGRRAPVSTDIETCLTRGDGRSFDHGRCSPCSTECVPRRYRLVTWVLTLGCSRKRAHPRARLAVTPGRGCPSARGAAGGGA